MDEAVFEALVSHEAGHQNNEGEDEEGPDEEEEEEAVEGFLG